MLFVPSITVTLLPCAFATKTVWVEGLTAIARGCSPAFIVAITELLVPSRTVRSLLKTAGAPRQCSPVEVNG